MTMKKVVIIGGGLGGLTAGALLAKKGYSVTLLEQHSIVGGCATTFQRGDFTCDVGLHEMDGVYSNPTIKEIFEFLKVYDYVEFVKPNEFFKVVTKYGEFIMPEGVKEAKFALRMRFPGELDAIESYFKLIEEVSKAFEKLNRLSWRDYMLFPFRFSVILKYKDKSVKEVLDSLTSNDELKLILNANVHYYNDTPRSLSFFLHAIAQFSYFRGGGWFVKGGSYNLSKYLASVITQYSGNIMTQATVVEASPNEVVYEYKNDRYIRKADYIISNISPQDTYRLFQVPYEEEKLISDSITTLYIGFSMNLKNIYPNGKYSSFFLDTMDSQDNFGSEFAEERLTRDFVFVDYSRIDSELEGDNISFGAVCMPDKISIWEGLDRKEYRKRKEELVEHVLNRLDRHYPNIRTYITFTEVATPKTMQRYLKTPNGTAYGYKPTPHQFFRIPKSNSDKMDNLYFVGQFVIGGGFSPAIMSGNICMNEIESRR